ncbi:MAG: copper resistance CopC family protein [Pseudonocardiaceae bacterium]
MRQLLASLMLVGMVLLGGVIPAAAHNELIGSDPADGATVAASPARVSLTFNLPVRPGFSTVIVTGPDQTQWQAGAAAEDGATVSMPVRPLGPAGQYTIAYQVLSADGHLVRGAIHFTLANPGASIAPAQSQPGAPVSHRPESATPSTATQTEAASTPVWPWLVGGVVSLVAGVAVAVRVGRRS